MKETINTFKCTPEQKAKVARLAVKMGGVSQACAVRVMINAYEEQA